MASGHKEPFERGGRPLRGTRRRTAARRGKQQRSTPARLLWPASFCPTRHNKSSGFAPCPRLLLLPFSSAEGRRGQAGRPRTPPPPFPAWCSPHTALGLPGQQLAQWVGAGWGWYYDGEPPPARPPLPQLSETGRRRRKRRGGGAQRERRWSRRLPRASGFCCCCFFRVDSAEPPQTDRRTGGRTGTERARRSQPASREESVTHCCPGAGSWLLLLPLLQGFGAAAPPVGAATFSFRPLARPLALPPSPAPPPALSRGGD